MTYIGKTTTISFGYAANNEHSLLAVDAIGDLSFTADEIEDTVYGASMWKTFVQGLKDGGSVDITVNYDSDDTSANALYDAFVDGSSNKFLITFPDASNLQFTGFISGIGFAIPKDEKYQQTFTVRIDGKTAPVFSEVV